MTAMGSRGGVSKMPLTTCSRSLFLAFCGVLLCFSTFLASIRLVHSSTNHEKETASRSRRNSTMMNIIQSNNKKNSDEEIKKSSNEHVEDRLTNNAEKNNNSVVQNKHENPMISTPTKQDPPPLPSGNMSSFSITVAHTPRRDLLGSFVAPTLFLLAVAHAHGWELAIMPFTGSKQEAILKKNIALKDKINWAWGSGFQDASSRPGFDPVALVTDAYSVLGFFPPTSFSNATDGTSNMDWIFAKVLAPPGSDELERICQPRQSRDHCYIMLPDNPHDIQAYMQAQHGGTDAFFTPAFRQSIRETFLEKNHHRLQHFGRNYDDKKNDDASFNIAMHVRRGDITDPKRWINQTVYAAVAQHICQTQKGRSTHVHVYSSGPNRDGNWDTLKGLNATCSTVSFHLDQEEFNTWTHMVVADALIMSKSAFSEVPALLSRGDVYFPDDYWHLKLSSWKLFHHGTGELVTDVAAAAG